MDNWNSSVSVPLKLIITCNLKQSGEEAIASLAYLKREFSVRMRDAGLDMTNIWLTIYGNWPHIRMIFNCKDPDTLGLFLASKDWIMLKEELLLHTVALKHKVVISRDNFQF